MKTTNQSSRHNRGSGGRHSLTATICHTTCKQLDDAAPQTGWNNFWSEKRAAYQWSVNGHWGTAWHSSWANCIDSLLPPSMATTFDEPPSVSKKDIITPIDRLIMWSLVPRKCQRIRNLEKLQQTNIRMHLIGVNNGWSWNLSSAGQLFNSLGIVPNQHWGMEGWISNLQGV